MLPVLLILLAGRSCGKKGKVQVILISIDTLRGDHLDAYGYSRETAPNLSRLINDSVYYKQAYANGAWTYPSHASMLTGTLPSRNGVNQDLNSFAYKGQGRAVNDSIFNIAEILKKELPELKTIKFAKLPNEIGFARGFDANNNFDPFLTDNKFSKILNALDKNRDKDFFLFLHTWMVHAPYANSYFLEKEKLSREKRNFIDLYRKPGTSKKKKSNTSFRTFLLENNLFNVKDCVALYDGGIRYTDHYIGQLINKLKEIGIYDNTMLIVTSDHGEHFGEHAPYMFYDHHGNNFYEEFIKIPIIVKYPRQKRINTLSHTVSLIDLVPTILDYFHIDIPAYIQGESLLLPYDKRRRKYYIGEGLVIPDKERKSIRIGNLKYIVTMEKAEGPARTNWKNIVHRGLFNLENDPEEKINLFKDSKFKAIAFKFERMLKQIIRKSAKLNRSGKATRLQQETIDHMKSLGYL
jgi:arylsulfatase A-like enzyme